MRLSRRFDPTHGSTFRDQSAMAFVFNSTDVVHSNIVHYVMFVLHAQQSKEIQHYTSTQTRIISKPITWNEWKIL